MLSHIRLFISDLTTRLNEAERATNEIDNLNRQTDDHLTDVLVKIDTIPSVGYGSRVKDAVIKATSAQQRAAAAKGKVLVIVNNLSKDNCSAHEMVYNTKMAKTNMKQTNRYGELYYITCHLFYLI